LDLVNKAMETLGVLNKYLIMLNRKMSGRPIPPLAKPILINL